MPTGRPRNFSRYWITGWLKRTRVAPAASASSALNSAAYVYALVGGSGPGMAAGPFGPTVYSVARTVSVVMGCVEPSAKTRLAAVPWRMNSVARRVPALSVIGLPRTTWMGVLAARSTGTSVQRHVNLRPRGHTGARRDPAPPFSWLEPCTAAPLKDTRSSSIASAQPTATTRGAPDRP